MKITWRFLCIGAGVFAALLSGAVSARTVHARKAHAHRTVKHAVHHRAHGMHISAQRASRYQGRFGLGALDGSVAERRTKLAYENSVADELKLPRFQTLEEIRAAASSLVRVPDDFTTFFVDEDVDRDRRYLQPWSYAYLVLLANDFANEAGASSDYPKIKITSLVRDLAYQLHSVRSIAKCKEPETCSTHLTGATFDISFRGMSKAQFDWLYKRLTRDRDLGLVNAIHEPQSGCFHIFVVPTEK